MTRHTVNTSPLLFLMATLLTFGCGDDGSDGGGGGGNEPISVDDACAVDSDCLVGLRCVEGAFGKTCTADTPGGNPDDCEAACDNLVMCSTSTCSSPFFEKTTCVSDCSADPQGFKATSLAQSACDAIVGELCEDTAFASACDCASAPVDNPTCTVACTRLNDCAQSICDTEPIDVPRCLDDCNANPDGWTDIKDASCDAINAFICQEPEAFPDCECAVANGCEAACDNVVACGNTLCDTPYYQRVGCLEQCNDDPSAFGAALYEALPCDLALDRLCGEDEAFRDACDCQDHVGQFGEACTWEDADSRNGSLICGADYTCTLQPLTGYSMIITELELAEENQGECWDFNCGAPDIQVTLFDSDLSFLTTQSAVFEDTFTAPTPFTLQFPDSTVGSDDIYVLLVHDVDFADNDEVMACGIEMTPDTVHKRVFACEVNGNRLVGGIAY